MTMVISGGKSDLGKEKLPFDEAMAEIESAPDPNALTPAKKKREPIQIKLPFLDLYLVSGVKIRRRQESKKTQTKMMDKLLKENIFLRRRLARYEG